MAETLSEKTRTSSDDPRWADSETVFACPWFEVQRSGRWHRVRGNGGAVAFARTPIGIVFVEVYRPQTGRRHLELPRGNRSSREEGDVACALRELLEETGYRADPETAWVLGQVHPDTGLAGPGAVSVISVSCAATPTAGTDGEVERVRVIPEDRVWELIARGGITCGITLAAMGLYAAREPHRGTAD